MQQLGICLSVDVPINNVLEALAKNLEAHEKIVEEAQKGYIQEAQLRLAGRLKTLQAGKPVNLEFSLRPPQDRREAYKEAISMLTAHSVNNDSIVLDTQQYAAFISDKWAWSDSFYRRNAQYSLTASSFVSP